MLDIDGSTWQRLSPLLDEALALPTAERGNWLQSLPPQFADLRPWLQELLADRAQADWALPTLDEAAEPEPWAAGQAVGAYRLLRPLGRGGMGTVWLAQRDDLPRPVALKLPRGLGGGPQLAERMARERDLLASLEHPHIARLYDAGLTDGGQPFLALEYVAGRPIDQHCNARSLGLPERLALFMQAAQAVAHAHSKLIVHRDLKPSNLMVSDGGDVKLLDFGIAKLVAPDGDAGSGPALTRAGALPMTPEYAAPEQVAGQDVDTRADVYALGVVLFELLTGQRPYRLLRITAAAVENAILQQDVPRPSDAVRDRARSRALRGDLDTIVAKALKKDPAERYPTVQALADDLQRHLAHQPVLARPDRLGYVLRRLMQRHRLRFAAAGVALVGVVAGTGLAAWQAHRAELERQRAAAVSDFFTRLLRDASPYRATAADWRTQRLLARLLRSAQPGSGEVLQVSAVDLLRQAGRQLEGAEQAEPQTRAQLMRVVAEGLAAFGDLPQAQALARRATDEAVQRLGPDHPQTLRLRLAQVLVQRYQGDHEPATQTLSALLPALRAQASGDPESLVVGLQLMAVQALDQGAVGEALEAVDEAKNWLPRLPDRSGEPVGVELLRARALRVAGQHEASRLAAAEAGRDAARLHGSAPHPNHIEAQVAQARAAAAVGDVADAVRHYEAALDGARRLLGADSPLVAFLLNSAVPLDLELGADERADQRSAEALRLAARHMKPGTYLHDITALTRAQVLLAQGLPAPALELSDQALPTLRRIFGGNHRQAMAAAALRAQALAQLGRIDEARQALPEAALSVDPARPADDGDGAPLGLRLATARAMVWRNSGEPAAAVALLQPLLAADTPERRWRRDVAQAEVELALALESLQQSAAARRHWAAVLAIGRDAQRPYPTLAALATAALERTPH